MKRKVYLVFFIVFLLAAALAGYKFISAELDFRSAVDYYDNLADTWVKTNSPQSGPEQTAAPTEGQLLFSEHASVTPENTESAAVSPVHESEKAGSVAAETQEPEDEPPVHAVENASAPAETVAGESNPGFTVPESEKSNPSVTDPAEQEVPSPAEDRLYTAELPPITVDFDSLCRRNPEIVGWIYCADSPVNYPVLQASDNKKYLKTQPDGKTSGSGAIFIDCNCRRDFASDNTIMYGHNLKNKMFSCLLKYDSQSYYDAHSVMWLLTPGGDYRIELFAGFVIKDGGRVYVIDLLTPQDWTDFTGYCLRSSRFAPVFQPEPDNRLITLSTCDGSFENARYVVIGSLIPVG